MPNKLNKKPLFKKIAAKVNKPPKVKAPPKPKVNKTLLKKKSVKSEIVTKPKTNKTNKKKKPKFIDDAIECRVCCDEFESDDEKEPLVCGHVFHYDCIVMSFQCPDVIRSCPYCRKHNGYLRLLDGMTPIKGIHKEYKEYYEKQQKNKVVSKCSAIYQGGMQKGLPCTNKAKNNSPYCGLHKNYDN